MKKAANLQKNSQDDLKGERLDLLKWGLVIALLAGGVVANIHFSAEALSIRLIAWIALLIVTGLIAAQTTQGRQVRSFAVESQIEIRKVVWPSRQETMQTTLLVVAMVLLLGVILWGVDTGLLWAIGQITQ